MAAFHSLKGTTLPYFAIGKNGITLYQGSSDPTGSYTVADGDIWFDTANGSIKSRGSSMWNSAIADNIAIATNSILATNTNGDINLVPDGTGIVSVSGTEVATVGANIFTGEQTISSTSPTIRHTETDAGTNEKNWDFYATSGQLLGITRYDNLDPGEAWLIVDRSAQAITTIDFQNGTLQSQGNTVWHAGNDGAGSGLDADTVDTIEGANITTLSGTQTITGAKTFSAPVVFPTYTVATLPTASSYTGGQIFVSDETGGAVMAFSDGTTWRRMTDRAAVS